MEAKIIKEASALYFKIRLERVATGRLKGSALWAAAGSYDERKFTLTSKVILKLMTCSESGLLPVESWPLPSTHLVPGEGTNTQTHPTTS